MLDTLPPELLRACLAALGSAVDLLRATRVSRAFSREAKSDELWKELYDKRWPPWTLLVPESVQDLHGGTLTQQQLYRRRRFGQLRLAVSPHVHMLHGTTTDNYDNNETPLEAAMCLAPTSRLSTVLEISGRLLAQVHFGEGTKHNSSAVKCWLGKELRGAAGPSQVPTQPLGLPAVLQASPVRVEWREHSATFGHWIYEGEVTSDGREIVGTFHLSILKRKWGRFVLRACDPATHVGEAFGGLPTANQLVKRVAVKWCKAALDKAAAREELQGV